MNCNSCGTSLKAGAKFCGSCGAKTDSTPEEQGLAFAPSPLGLDKCDISIVEVKGEGPDSDGGISIEIKYEVTNKSDEDWEYLVARTQLLDANGLPLEESLDTYEQTIAAGDTGELEAYLGWRIKFKSLGATPERTKVLVNLVACGTRMQKLGEFDVPATAFDVVPLKSTKVGNVLQLVSGSLWKTEPDSDKDSNIQVRALVQNLTAMHVHEVQLIAEVTDKAGRDITNATNGSEEVRPGDVCLISSSGYGKDKQFKGAKVALSLRAYFPVATGLSQHFGIEIHESESRTEVEDDEDSSTDAAPEAIEKKSVEQALTELYDDNLHLFKKGYFHVHYKDNDFSVYQADGSYEGSFLTLIHYVLFHEKLYEDCFSAKSVKLAARVMKIEPDLPPNFDDDADTDRFDGFVHDATEFTYNYMKEHKLYCEEMNEWIENTEQDWKPLKKSK
jgi:hypothetical protein